MSRNPVPQPVPQPLLIYGRPATLSCPPFIYVVHFEFEFTMIYSTPNALNAASTGSE